MNKTTEKLLSVPAPAALFACGRQRASVFLSRSISAPAPLSSAAEKAGDRSGSCLTLGEDDLFGCDTWEDAEKQSAARRPASGAPKKAGLHSTDIRYFLQVTCSDRKYRHKLWADAV